MNRPLESYSSAVLAEFIRVKGISYFQEALDAIEARLSVQSDGRCTKCRNHGCLPDGSWCSCAFGKELQKTSVKGELRRREQSAGSNGLRSASPDGFNELLKRMNL